MERKLRRVHQLKKVNSKDEIMRTLRKCVSVSLGLADVQKIPKHKTGNEAFVSNLYLM